MPVTRFVPADRRALLLGTALASTLLLSNLLAPATALAVTPCTGPGEPAGGPQPIVELNVGAPGIVCINTEARASDGLGQDTTIELSTSANNAPITLTNTATGTLTATGGGDGIYVRTNGDSSDIAIFNDAAITAANVGIVATTEQYYSDIYVSNGGTLTTEAAGIYAYAEAGNVEIINRATITAGREGIFARTDTSYFSSDIVITNSAAIIGGLEDNGLQRGHAIYTRTRHGDITITNSAALQANRDHGIYAYAKYGDIAVNNKASINAAVDGIHARTGCDASKHDFGVCDVIGEGGDIAIVNQATIHAGQTGIYGTTPLGDIAIVNQATINAPLNGIHGVIGCENVGGQPYNCNDFIESGNIAIVNQATINAGTFGIFAHNAAEDSDGNLIGVVNTGTINAAVGILTITEGMNTATSVVNLGTINASYAGIATNSVTPGSTNFIGNAGTVHGGEAGIIAISDTFTHIVNTGSISAGNLLAIHVQGVGDALVQNAGLITGYVIFDFDDVFHNQSGGTFEARRTSFFGPGFDQFINDGVVHTAANPNASETTRFVDLERFQNRGLISMVDGKEGDQFQISQVVGAKSGLTFSGSGRSTLAVDAYLGPPGSRSDVFIIDGDASGRTGITVNNTNPGPGSYNPTGIPVVYVNGHTNGNEFTLPGGPIDTGFFDYDLFFRPTGSGIFYLRNFINGNAHLLPQLVTGAQDLFHATTETWLDRTADLRVLLNGGTPVHNLKDGGVTYVEGGSFTPAVWIRGSGAWLSYDDKATTSVQGRTYEYDLDRDLDMGDLQTGIDFGTRDFLAKGDTLVFGLLTGWVFGDLSYDQLGRGFDFSGLQAGGFATYLNGGLFVDTLIKADFLDIEQKILGFPDSIDATSFGIRTDSGYRFGGFNGGFFYEPLATIEVIWSDLDGFIVGDNRVSFDDDPSVRGRLGLRMGTSYQPWEGTTLEPFVIGAVWGNLSGDNHATLVSNGTTFHLTDDVQDVWGVVTGGLNIFNPGGHTSAFAKVDVTFGDDIDGLAARLGMRRTW